MRRNYIGDKIHRYMVYLSHSPPPENLSPDRKTKTQSNERNLPSSLQHHYLATPRIGVSLKPSPCPTNNDGACATPSVRILTPAVLNNVCQPIDTVIIADIGSPTTVVCHCKVPSNAASSVDIFIVGAPRDDLALNFVAGGSCSAEDDRGGESHGW